MNENRSFILQLFSALKPYQVNKGTGTGVSEIEALASENISNLIYAASKNKKELFKEYREMALFPEIADALDEIKSEAIVQDNDGKIVNLNILDSELSENENVVANLQKEFDYIISKVLDFNTNAWDLFGKFYVEGELYAELMLDKDKKEQGILGIRYLPAYTMSIEYGDNQEPTGYKQDLKGLNLSLGAKLDKTIARTQEISFAPTQVAYINSGMVDFKKNLVYSYLERAKVAYKQLKWMENALIVYRITRAPERRVFYIDVGKLPKHSADEYVQSLISKFKNKKIYNPTTGDIDVGKDVMSMEEDYFFPQRSDGSGSKVETLPGGCLSLETEIPLLDGRTEKLSTLINEFTSGKKNWVYSCNPDTGSVVPGEITWAGVTHKNTEVLKLTLDNDEEIICTPDHKFPIWGKGKTEAKDLVIGDSVIPFNKKMEVLFNNSEYEQVFDNYHKKWEYTHRMVANYFKSLNTHNIFEFDEKYKLENKDTIHHRDFNRYNNNPENLEWMHNKDHYKYHSSIGFSFLSKEQRIEIAKYANSCHLKYMKEDNEYRNNWISKNKEAGLRYSEYWENPDPLVFEAFSSRMKTMVANRRAEMGEEFYLKWQKEVSKKGSDRRIELQNNDLEFKNAVYEKSGSSLSKILLMEGPVRTKMLSHVRKIQTPWNNQSVYYDEFMLKKVIDYFEVCKKTYPNSLRQCKSYAKYKDVLNKLNEDEEFISYFQDKNSVENVKGLISKIKIDKFEEHHLFRMLKQFNYTSWKNFSEKITLYNHRIVKIEHLSQRVDVGTLTIDGYEKYHNYHTFALKSGIFTFNSGLGELGDVEYFLKKLYKALKVPQIRMLDQTNLYTPGRSNEVTREEVKFAKYIQSVRTRFSDFLYQVYFTHLQLKGLYSQYKLDKSKISINFTENNTWRELRELEMKRARMDIFKDQMEFVDVFPVKYLMKDTLRLTDADITTIEELMEEQKKMGGGGTETEPSEPKEEDVEPEIKSISPELINGYLRDKNVI